MAGVVDLVKRYWASSHPPELAKKDDAIRIGLFGTSWIAYV
jgi:hypothetical protein